MTWYEDIAAQRGAGRSLTYGERIKRNGSSAKRASKMTGLPYHHARELTRWLRTGAIPTLPAPSCPASAQTPVKQPSSNRRRPKTPEDAPTADYLLSADYIYNDRDDTYVTFVSGLPKPITLSGETHRGIIRAYSNGDGQPASINEVARAFGIARSHLVRYLRVHGMTHDREPFTPEELATRTDAALLDDALQMRRMAIHKKLERAKWAETVKDALRWRDLDANLMAPILAALADRAPVVVAPLALPTAHRPFAAFIGLTDFHWGKYSDPGENFTRYNRTIARRRLFDATAELVEDLARRGRPDVIYVPIGSDFLHVDNQAGTTTRGTPCDSDGTAAELFVTACDLLEEWIAMLLQAGPVELVLMSGNHDRLAGLMMLKVLEAVFRSHPDVSATMERTPRVYLRYGANQIGLVHGDGVSKPAALAMHMAMEAPDAWAACRHKTIYTGHLHHEKTRPAQPGADTSYNVTCRQLPAIAGTDRWHAHAGFIGAPQALPMYIHDRERGMVAQVLSTVTEGG